MARYIVEHPTRGVLLERLSDSGKPSFSPTAMRNDKRLATWFTLRRARLDLEALNVPGAYVLRAPLGPGDQYQKYLGNGEWANV